MTLGKLLSLSELQFPHLQNEENKRTYLLSLYVSVCQVLRTLINAIVVVFQTMRSKQLYLYLIVLCTKQWPVKYFSKFRIYLIVYREHSWSIFSVPDHLLGTGVPRWRNVQASLSDGGVRKYEQRITWKWPICGQDWKAIKKSKRWRMEPGETS